MSNAGEEDRQRRRGAHALDTPLASSLISEVKEFAILAVEDSVSDFSLLEGALRRTQIAKVRLIQAYSVRQALECLEWDTFDLVLLDLNLTDSWGIATFKQLYQKHREIPIVILSGYDCLEVARQAVEQGAQDYLLKNQMRPDLLERVLQYALARHHHVKEITQTNQALGDLNRTLQSILFSIGDGVVVADAAGRIILRNAAAERSWSHTRGDSSFDEWFAHFGFFYSDEKTPFPAERLPMVRALRGESVNNQEMFLRNAKVPCGIHISVNARPMFNEEGALMGGVLTYRDTSERRLLEQQMRHDATHDALTHLPNRMLFLDRLQQRLYQHQRGPGPSFAVLYLDLDRFKNINDSWGHAYGDQILREVAGRLKASLRKEDTVARLGGDEFVLLLHTLQEPYDALHAAERIHELLSAPLEVAGHTLLLSASIGLALRTPEDTTAAELLRNAEIAMYEAKAQGKACHVVFGEEMHQRVSQLFRLEHELRLALRDKEFALHFQPIVSTHDQQVRGFEALIRWIRPGGQHVSPGQFIPVAESTGLIVPMGWWILDEACRHLKMWHELYAERGLTLSVNLSARQFSQPDLVKQIDAILARHQLNASFLKLEITETAIMDSPSIAAQTLQKLRERHIQIYMDDFGTGYSSLSYLHNFPVDVLKIDRSFVWDMQEDSQHTTIVETIVSLAHKLGMKVVAEGVETREQAELLRAMNVTYAQGYYFSKPLSAEQTLALLHESNDAALRCLP